MHSRKEEEQAKKVLLIIGVISAIGRHAGGLLLCENRR